MDAKVLRYFHNTGYHELSGEDYDKLFATYSGDGHLPTYVELLRFDAGPGADRRRAAAESPASCSAATWPAARPTTRSPASPARSRPTCPRCSRGRPRTTTPTPSTTRGWSAPRWSCSPATCAGCSPSDGEKAAAAARRRGRRLEDAAVPAGPAARLRRRRRGRARWPTACDAAVTELDSSGCLGAVRTGPRVRAGHAGAGPGRRRGRATSASRTATADAAQGVLEVGGIATVWDLLVNGEVVRVGAVDVRAAVVDVADVARRATTRCASSCTR